jgi:release factor glutamine methyltransferase
MEGKQGMESDREAPRGATHAEPPSESSGGAAVRAAGPWTVRRLLAWINSYLGDREVDSARLVSEILVSEVLGVERLRLYMEPDRELDADELSRLRALVARAGRHEPVQYLVGKWSFFGRDFLVAPCTLIPRPCTEVLVESALAWYRARGGGEVRAIDLCTGTGCIAISLQLGFRAVARPAGAGCRPLQSSESAPVASRGTLHRVVATDIVRDAVDLARSNAVRLGAEVEFLVGDMWDAVDGVESLGGEPFDLVVSNPPYVTDAEYGALDRNVREFEPATALRGGEDGLCFIRKVVDGAPSRLRSGGLLLVEIGWKHGADSLRLVSGPEWRDASVIKDGDGIDRVLRAVRA